MGLRKVIRSNSAVSEVMGTILLLMIVVGLFSVVSISVFNLLPFNPAPSADIICQVNGDNIILTHRGGDALSLDTKIGFSTSNGSTQYIVVKDYLNTTEKADGKWSIGEKILYSNFNLLQNQIQVMVVDPSSNSFILSVSVPIVNSISATTGDATSITMNSADLWLNYDLRTQSGSVRFTYRPSDGGWINTSWTSKNGSGSYNIVISGLSPVKLYYFKGQLLYNSTIIEGDQKSFTTLDITNNPPTITTPNPTNGSTEIPITTALLSITIQDPEGDLFNWNIATSPNIGSNTGTAASNGTKTCTITGLAYLTTYTWTVKVYDGHHWTNRSYVFTTGICPVIDTSVNMISPYALSVNPLTITAAGNSDLDNVTLYYRWSDDNSSWTGGLNEIYDSVDSSSSNLDSSVDKGVENNFPNAQGISRDANVMTIQEANQGYAAGDENKVVDSWDSNYNSWTETGATPYLNADDYSTNYITIATRNNNEGWFTFADTTASAGATVTCTIYINGWRSNTNGVDDYADVYVDYTGGSGSDIGDACTTIDSNGVQTINVGSLTITQANALRVYFRSTRVGSAMATLYIDYVYVRFQWSASPNYNIDFEYQWTAAVYNQANKQVCLYVALHTGTENLLVNYWTGSAWSALGTITGTGWSNFTATGVSSSTYTIQLKGATESGDSSQDSWSVDLIMLDTWNTTGGSHGQNWIIWTAPNNPDASLPWSWNFDFPRGVGYYEFYSIGKDIGHCGGDIESAPASADAKCHKT